MPVATGARASRYRRSAEKSMHQVVQNELLRAVSGLRGDAPEVAVQLAAVVDQMPVAVFVVEAPAGRLLVWNRRAAEFWNGAVPRVSTIAEYAERYEALRPDGSLYRAEDLPVARSLRHGEVVVDEEIEFRIDGRSRLLLVSTAPVRDAAGKVCWAVATAADVTARRREQRRREFLSRFAALVQQAPHAHETLRSAASSLGEHLGASSVSLAEADEALRVLHVHAEYRNGVFHESGRHDFDEFGAALTAELRAGGIVAIEDVATSPLVDDAAVEAFTALEARSVLIARAGRARARDGFVVVMHVAPRRWSRDDVDTVQQVAARAWAAHDELERATTRRMSEQWLRFALRAGDAAAWEWDLASDRLSWSEEHHEVLGTDPSQPIRTTQDFVKLIHEADRERALRGIVRIGRLDAARDVGMECRIVRSDGGTRWIRVQGRVLLGEHGRPTRAYGVMLDVTERKQAELEREALLRRLRAADEAKSNFISVMSHEFRTPLTSVIGYTELLLTGASGELNARQHEQLGRIKSSAWHLTQVIDEVLTFSRVEAGREEVRLRRTDVLGIAREAVAIIEPAARSCGLVLIAELPDELIMDTDGGKLRQILVNLLGNAVKFTTEGSIRLTIRAEAGRVRFIVADTGIGIAAEHLDRIFERFWQVDQGSTRARGGTGLGLTVTRRLTEVLGGTIRVESEPGAGSTFTVELPA
jgi:PAS domain S-box-containing protein